ncbi:hypothetical protein [Nocardia sp. SC052]|uniref:hypothetical protein n=1 Tax=Nocardia sichangensis TaxID=3385975 RepID=UPI0039A066FC
MPPDAHPIGRAMTACAPEGWHRADAVFGVTVGQEIGTITYYTGEQSISARAPDSVITAVREHRAAWASMDAGPWWRMLLSLTKSGELEVEYDYGELPFPPGQLFAPEQYRADLAAYPRDRIPVWLAAYIGHDDRQLRTPQQAAAQARSDRADEVWATLAENEFPPFPVMWARWATIAAAFVAARSDRGPRMAPWTAIYESAEASGSTLHVLPGGRAVLSGGVWNAPTLDAVYNDGAPMPRLYGGAPEWLTDHVLNPRAATGLLSFCYWWQAGRWYRGQSPTAVDCATAVPGIWTGDTVAAAAGGLTLHGDSGSREAIAALVAAAEAGTVTRDLLAGVFGDDERADVDGALYQYALAGLTMPAPQTMPGGEAISRVRDYIAAHRLDTTEYPLGQLIAERFSVGWMVYVPVPDGQHLVGRAIFYIGDDGFLEHSSSSTAPPLFITHFEQRFAERQGLKIYNTDGKEE